MLLSKSFIANFGYVPKNIDKGRLLKAWGKLSAKYEPVGSGTNGMVRRTMLDVLDFENTLNPDNVTLLTKHTTMPNGLPGTVYTGATHAPVSTMRRTVDVHTLAGNPLSVKNPMYKGAIDSLGDVLEATDRTMGGGYKAKIFPTSATAPLYKARLGYVHSKQGMPISDIRAYRRGLGGS